MTTETEVKVEKKKGGRPVGYSPAKTPKDVQTLAEDGEYVVIRVKKKELMKLLLKDLI